MSALFESEVYQLEQSVPYCGPKALLFMAAMAGNGGDAVLKVRHRLK